MSLRSVALLLLVSLACAACASGAFHFVLLGDRTGETQPGVFEEALREATAENPAFVISTGDLIEGLDDTAASGQWQALENILRPFRRYPFYPAPGNHDVWSTNSETLFRNYTGHALHYSFDYQSVHVTILDNSRTEQLSAAELGFLENDLRSHAAQPVKVIVSHRPSWVLDAVLRNPDFPLHRLARKYGVQAVVAGHIHQMLRVTLDGVEYLSMPSSGGHLRLAKRYQDGWFYGYAWVTVTGNAARIEIKELNPPHGRGRVTVPENWGAAGLVEPNAAPSVK